ncbi:MAG: hypothetical protein H7Z37_08035 [Pyrinomonadaceae bacterium]|nr:hypothetical protein [Pyrinomonadaceae bacterium]
MSGSAYAAWAVGKTYQLSPRRKALTEGDSLAYDVTSVTRARLRNLFQIRQKVSHD